MSETLRRALLTAGVRNLKQFGYPSVTAENILTDPLYRAFFRPMLEEHSGTGKVEAQTLLAEMTRLEQEP